MKFISIIALLASPLAITATRVSWDPAYDKGKQSLATVSCSDGPNGLLTKGYNTFENLPTFPDIAASSAVTWNSPNCGSSHFTKVAFMIVAHCATGTCWNITYLGKTVTVTVVDRAGDGYTLSKSALNKLTCVDFHPLLSRICLLIRIVVITKPSGRVLLMGLPFRSPSRFVVLNKARTVWARSIFNIRIYVLRRYHYHGHQDFRNSVTTNLFCFTPISSRSCACGGSSINSCFWLVALCQRAGRVTKPI